MIRDMMSRYIAIYLAISHTPNHLETPGTNPNSTKTHHLVAVYSCFFRLCLGPHLGCVRPAFFVVLLLSISWTHHRTDRITSKQQPCPLRTRPAPWAHAWLFLFNFSFFSFSFLSFPVFFPSWYLVYIPGTPYSSCEAPDILLLLPYSGMSCCHCDTLF